MVGLIDIAPSVETIDVEGTSVAVHGVSAKGLAHLPRPLSRVAHADDRTGGRGPSADDDDFPIGLPTAYAERTGSKVA
jgi:hypothetical protein